MLSEILIPDAILPHTCKADTPISSFHISFPFLYCEQAKWKPVYCERGYSTFKFQVTNTVTLHVILYVTILSWVLSVIVWWVGMETGRTSLAEMVAENVTGFLTHSQEWTKHNLLLGVHRIVVDEGQTAGQLTRFAFILTLDNVDGKEEKWTKILS